MDILIDYSDWLIEMGYDTTVDYVYDIGPSVYGMDDLHKFISYQKSLDNLNDYKRRDWREI